MKWSFCTIFALLLLPNHISAVNVTISMCDEFNRCAVFFFCVHEKQTFESH